MSARKAQHSTRGTVTFVIALCLSAALILSVLSAALRSREDRSRQLDRAKQILAAARIYNPAGYFQIKEGDAYVPAKYDGEKLVAGTPSDKASADEIYAISTTRLRPLLADNEGKIQTFADAGIDLDDYLADNAKRGFADLPQKLFYEFLANGSEEVEGYIIPMAGFGLWGPVYGYVALELNADTIVGVTWQGPMETPGLGAIIQDPEWQAQFDGKEIFLPKGDSTDFKTAPLGITVVKGKVSDVYGDTPRANTAVDGITGATLTGDGVSAAFTDSLGPYRNLLIQLHGGANGS